MVSPDAPFAPLSIPGVSSEALCEAIPGVVSVPIDPPVVKVAGFLLPDARDRIGEDDRRGRSRSCNGCGGSTNWRGLHQEGRPQDIQLQFYAPLASTPPGAAHQTLSSSALPACRRTTRIRPPRDVVKLEDRLHYLLQPPLEALLAADAIRFPHAPFPFQLDGVAFLFARREAVLADEMGLGKTMQAITTIRLLFRHGKTRRVLLVCPKPVVTTWQRELALWAAELPVAVVAGGQQRRAWFWRCGAPGVTIANYELIVRDEALLSAGEGRFDLVVLDEAQRIKNARGATNGAICRVPRTRSWALTGTPIENSTDDLVGIFNFVSPRLIHSDMRPWAMARAVSDHVLRRVKDDVLADLPPRLDRDTVLPLSCEQATSYERAEQRGVVRLNAMGRELRIQHVFELILRLKQICNFDPATGASVKSEQLECDLESCAASGQKAIVFSQWVLTLASLRCRRARFGPRVYHGHVSPRDRETAIERFRNDPDCRVLLMSYGAGSVGLNLQFASYVFLFDRWWNPAVEDQAIHRVHRIGSARPVTVTRFLTAGTIEERIEQILAEKRKLFGTMFGTAWCGAKLGLSGREALDLLGLQPENTAAQTRRTSL